MPRLVMGRAARGLFGQQQIRFGNRVSFSQRKTRRTWKPNVQRPALFSPLLDRTLRVPVTTKILKTITKHQGVDNYLLWRPPRKTGADVEGSTAWKLRQEMIKSWEKKEGRAFNRRRELWERRMAELDNPVDN